MAFTETLVRPKSVPVNELPDQTSFQNVNHAFILSPGGTFCYKERPTPKIESERDVIVRVVATGLCGSDVCSALGCVVYNSGHNLIAGPLLATWKNRTIRSQ